MKPSPSHPLRLFALAVALVVFGLSAPAVSYAQPEVSAPVDQERLLPPHLQGRPFEIVGLEDKPALAEAVEETAWAARELLLEAATVDWPGSALIVWVESESDFTERTGFRPHHVAAAANPRTQTVYINSAAWRRTDAGSQLTVMTHELAHLLLGSLPGAARRQLPLWVEEGLAQSLAGEHTWQKGASLMRARAAGAVPTLSDLEKTFPRDPAGQELAYAVSMRAVEMIAADHGDEPGSVARIMRRLADDKRGPEARAEYWSPAYRDKIEALLGEALGSRMHSWIVIGSSGTAIWFFIMVLAIVAWRKKRRRRVAYAQAMQDDEPWAASLTEQDVREVWGEPEDVQREPEPDDEYPWERWERLHGSDNR